MRFTSKHAALLAATAAMALQAGGALAQAEQDYAGGHKPVLQDFKSELGVRHGSFILYPELTTSLEYHDNIYWAENNEESDFIARVAPGVTLESQWSRHSLRLTGGVAYGAYLDNEEDNYLDAYGEIQGVYDISRIAALRATARYDRLHEGRGNLDVSNSALEPVDYTVLTGRLDGRYKPNRIRISPFVEISKRDYNDISQTAGIQNNDDRDRTRYGGGVEVGYEFIDNYEGFLRGEVDTVRYSSQFDDAGIERDSVGIKTIAGVRFDLSSLVTADLGLGYITRDYEDATLDTLSGFTAEATATWSVTPLTTLIFSLERDIEETTQGGASGAFTTIGEFEVVHSLRRDVLVSGFINAVDRDFEGGNRQEMSNGLGLGVEWALNRNLTVEGRYEHSRRDSNVANGDYTANQFSLALTTKY